MSEKVFKTPTEKAQAEHPISENAIIVDGVAHNGNACRIIDNTGGIEVEELRSMLDGLIENKAFGISGLSAKGGDMMRIGEAEFTHVQIGEEVYRLIVFPYEARIEAF